MAATIPPHEVRDPQPEDLGTDPEPIGVRFEKLIAQRRQHGEMRSHARPSLMPTPRSQRALRRAAGRAHVGAR